MGKEEIYMLEIQDKLVSLDLAENYFCCDLQSCLGQCCIEGDAGAPLTEEEKNKIEAILPDIIEDLLPRAKEEINKNGIAYIDEEGDLVTSILDGQNCVFTTYGPDGMCLCAIEKAWREGRIDFRKPSSCHLYPVRITEYPTFTALNRHKWKICKCAELLGRKKKIRLYQFLEEPLTEKFGKDWYAELKLACDEYLKQYGDNE